jgi:hypothetical protein
MVEELCYVRQPFAPKLFVMLLRNMKRRRTGGNRYQTPPTQTHALL